MKHEQNTFVQIINYSLFNINMYLVFLLNI